MISSLNMFHMRQSKATIIRTFSIIYLLCCLGCGKDKTTVPPEEALRISMDAQPFVVLPGPDFEFSLTVESAMPQKGVSIDFSVDGEKDGINYYYSPPVQTKDSRTRLKVQYTPRQVMCVCTVNVRSAGDPGNKASKTFRLVYK